MVGSTLSLPGLSPVQGKSVKIKFDGGQLSSDGGILALREVEKRLGVADRLAGCIADRRSASHVRHSLAEIIRFRLLMISAGYEDGIDANTLRSDPMFKMAMDQTPGGPELCSQSTISRLENQPDVRTLLGMGQALVDLYCASFAQVPNRIVLDIDDTFDAVHGGQQLRLFNAHHDEYGFQPIVVFDGPQVLDWCRANGVDFILGVAPTSTLRRHIKALECSTLERFQADPLGKLRRYKDFYDGAKSWSRVERIVARVEVGPQGADTRFIVTNLKLKSAKRLYEDIYCQRGQAENHIKSWKTHLAADRTSCTKATANQFRLFLHAGAYWIM